jgi:flagellar basal body-associated protein FliL
MSHTTTPHTHETAPLHDPIDAWHDHSHDPKPQQAHAEVGNAGAIMGIGIALFMVIVVAVIAVYAYYVWYVTESLKKAEVASGQASPAIQARAYKQEAILNLIKGAQVKPVGETPGYTLAPIDQKIEQTARDYTAR